MPERFTRGGCSQATGRIFRDALPSFVFAFECTEHEASCFAFAGGEAWTTCTGSIGSGGLAAPAAGARIRAAAIAASVRTPGF